MGQFDAQRQKEQELVQEICDRLEQATGNDQARDDLARELLKLKDELSSFDTVRESYVAARNLGKLVSDAMEAVMNGTVRSSDDVAWLKNRVRQIFDQKKGML